jgi:acetolactate decarboxylase
MPKITADIPTSLSLALKDEVARTNTDESSIVTAALAQYLNTPVHTLFQVSTSGALVAAVYSGAVSVQSLLQHGDTGLGTFANLDGEMVVLDGHAYQVQGSGRVSEAPGNARVPFAVVTKFSPEVDLSIGPIANFSELQKRCDELRSSGNIFYAFRLDGTFKHIRIRAVNPPEAERLNQAGPVPRMSIYQKTSWRLPARMTCCRCRRIRAWVWPTARRFPKRRV